MYFTDIEAQAASLQTADFGVTDLMNRLDQAIAAADEISQFGVTVQNFDTLQQIYPELSQPEFSLSSHPQRLGADAIGNEAVAALSGGALAALIGAIVMVLGWVASKIFGGGSSGGGGMGSSTGPIAKLKAAKVEFDPETMVNVLEAALAEKGNKENGDIKRKRGEILVAGHIAQKCNDGSAMGDVRTMENIVKDIVDLLDDAGTGEKEIIRIVGGVIPAYLNVIIQDAPYLSADQKSSCKLEKATTLKAISDLRRKESEALSKSLKVTYGEVKMKPTASVDVDNTKFMQTGKMFERVQGELTKMKAQVDKIGKDKGGKRLPKDIKSISFGLKVILEWLKHDVVAHYAVTKKVLENYHATITRTSIAVVTTTVGLSEDIKAKVEKGTGFKASEIKEMGDKIKKGDLKPLGEIVAIAQWLEKNLTLTTEQKAKLAQAIEFKKVA